MESRKLVKLLPLGKGRQIYTLRTQMKLGRKPNNIRRRLHYKNIIIKLHTRKLIPIITITRKGVSMIYGLSLITCNVHVPVPVVHYHKNR